MLVPIQKHQNINGYFELLEKCNGHDIKEIGNNIIYYINKNINNNDSHTVSTVVKDKTFHNDCYIFIGIIILSNYSKTYYPLYMDIQDMLLYVLHRFIKKLENQKEEIRFHKFLYVMVQNLITNYVKREMNTEKINITFIQDYETIDSRIESTSFDNVLESENELKLDSILIQNLSTEDYQMFHLYYVLKVNVATITRIYNHTSRKQTYNILKKLTLNIIDIMDKNDCREELIEVLTNG